MSQSDFATQLITALTQIGVACGIAAGMLMLLLILAIVFLYAILGEMKRSRLAQESLAESFNDTPLPAEMGQGYGFEREDEIGTRTGGVRAS